MDKLKELLSEMMKAIAAHAQAIDAHIASIPSANLEVDAAKALATEAVNEIEAHEAK